MARLLAVLLVAGQLGCSALINRSVAGEVRPGDRVACAPTRIPTFVDLGLGVAAFVPLATGDDCGPDGCHGTDHVAASYTALLIGVPLLISALWGVHASQDCRDARAIAAAPGGTP